MSCSLTVTILPANIYLATDSLRYYSECSINSCSVTHVSHGSLYRVTLEVLNVLLFIYSYLSALVEDTLDFTNVACSAFNS